MGANQTKNVPGKGDGEGVSMKAHKQQLSIVEKGEKAMEAKMDANSCKVCASPAQPLSHLL